jgi:endonuclease/exonuclease/phosphatase family metal-dependent hydrolase
MKSKWLLLLFYATFWLGISASSKAQDTLTVLSYNIYHAESSQEAGKSMLQEIGQFIADQDPDFVALQEVDSATTRLAEINNDRSFGLADSLAKLAGLHAYFGKAISFDGGRYGIAILSKHKFDTHTVKLPNPRQGEHRVMVILEGKTSWGSSIKFVGTHLDHQYKENRLAQIKAIKEKISGHESAVILAGDFNFEPQSEEYQRLENQWLDAGWEYANKFAPAFTYPSESPEKRIDYIWLSNNTKWEVLEYKTPDIRYSDHLPVVAKVVVYSSN